MQDERHPDTPAGRNGDVDWQSQLVRFRGMSAPEQMSWLSSLTYTISMLARGTYEPGTNGVESPEDLRRFNELIHRVATYQRKLASGKTGGVPDDALFETLERELKVLAVDEAFLLTMLP